MKPETSEIMVVADLLYTTVNFSLMSKHDPRKNDKSVLVCCFTKIMRATWHDVDNMDYLQQGRMARN